MLKYPFELYRFQELESVDMIKFIRANTYKLHKPNLMWGYMFRIDDIRAQIQPIYDVKRMREMNSEEKSYGLPVLISSEERFTMFCKLQRWTLVPTIIGYIGLEIRPYDIFNVEMLDNE